MNTSEMAHNTKAVTSLEKRHLVFASKESIQIQITTFWLSPSGSSREANMADDVNKTLPFGPFSGNLSQPYII